MPLGGKVTKETSGCGDTFPTYDKQSKSINQYLKLSEISQATTTLPQHLGKDQVKHPLLSGTKLDAFGSTTHHLQRKKPTPFGTPTKKASGIGTRCKISSSPSANI